MEKGKIIRLGIVGCGDVTELCHLTALRNVSGVKVTGLADVNSKNLDRVARKFGIDGRYSSHQDLLGSDIAAVAVCTPPPFHVEVALSALKANKHVFIEKPLALNLSDCDLLLDRAADKPQLKVMVGFNLRWHRLVRAAKVIIENGELGEIKLVRTVFTSGVNLTKTPTHWRNHTEAGGGALLDLGSHHFDLLHFLFETEAVQDVFASSSPRGDTASVTINMDGIQVASSFSTGTGANHTIEVYGTEGWLKVFCYRTDGLEQFKTRASPSRLRDAVNKIGTVPQTLQNFRLGGDYAQSYADQWRHFRNAIAVGGPVACTLLDGRRALEIALAASESIVSGSVVVLGDNATKSDVKHAGDSLMATAVSGRTE